MRPGLARRRRHEPARALARLLIAVVAAAGLAGCGSGEGQRLSIATGGSGGVYFVLGGGLAEQIGEHLDGYAATAEVTSASVDNMYLIADGKSDLALTLADTAADAVQGTDTFDGEQVPAQALARLYNNLTQVAMLLPTDQYVDQLKERYGDFYASAEIEPGRYEGVEAPVKVVAVPNYLVVNRSMDPELAYQLTKLLVDQKKALAGVHPSAGRLELETAPKVAPLELHPGAKRYYDEQAKT